MGELTLVLSSTSKSSQLDAHYQRRRPSIHNKLLMLVHMDMVREFPAGRHHWDAGWLSLAMASAILA